MAQSPEGSLKDDLIVAEYEALRSEIEKWLELRQQLLLALLAIAGTFLSLGVQPGLSGMTVLVYPVLAMFLAVIGAHNDTRIGQINAYLRSQEETRMGGEGWETYRRRTFQKNTHPLALKGNEHAISTRGLYATTQVLALALGVVRLWDLFANLSTVPLAGVPLLVAAAATVYTSIVARHLR